jgi:hypothetical protein
MKEYELLMKFDEHEGEDIADAVYAIHQVVSNRQGEILDVAVCRAKMSMIFDYIEVKKRFDKLRIEINDDLSFDKKGFKVVNTKFQTLDEVEKAIRNKAFL